MSPDAIDLRTVFVLTTFVSVTTATAMVFLWRSHLGASSVPAWALGSLLVAAGYLGIALRGWVPLFVSIPLANTCITVGHACFLSGVNRLKGRKPLPWTAFAALGIVIMAGLSYFTYVQSSTASRMAIQFVVIGLLSVVTALRLLPADDRGSRLTHLTVAGIFAIHGLASLIRVGLMAFDVPESNLFAPNVIHEVVFVVMLLFYAALMYCFPALLFAKEIAERKATETALRDSDMAYRAILTTSLDGFWLVNVQGKILDVNSCYTRQSGYSREELLTMSVTDLEAKESADDTASHIQHMIETGGDQFESLHRRKDGSTWYVEASVIYLDSGGGKLFAFLRDISVRKQVEDELRIAAAAFESQEGMVVTDANSVILRVNRAFTEISGYTAQEIVGRTPRLLKSGRHNADFYREMWETINRTGGWQGEIWDRRKNGEEYPKWLTISAVKDDEGAVTHYVGTHFDITKRKLAEEEINQLAFFDQLTGLPNRTLLLDRLKQTIAANSRSGTHGALLFIDLDNFKAINDTQGHDMGDMLLKQVAQRLGLCVREGDTVARLGGDEFVVMLGNLGEHASEAAARAETIGEKVLAALGRTYLLDGHDCRSTPSIGVTLIGNRQESMEELLKQADLAMYQAKTSGRNALRFFDPEMQAAVAARVALERDLRNAVREQEFILYYQAQVDAEGRCMGAEVLVRWQHPQRGMVFPDDFIPLSEETGLILPLGHWVMETACAQLAAWAARPDTAHLTLAVNVSGQQMHREDFVEQVLNVLERTGADPGKLKLELTESYLLTGVEDAIAKMTLLRDKGVGFALDDFGTGYSSLSYLKRLPLEKLKIDRSFVMDVLTDPNDAAIAKTIVALAQSLGLAVIAEGVETEEQRDFLARNGCHSYQGYLFSRPLPLEGFEEFVKPH